jgi:hypothetical protein
VELFDNNKFLLHQCGAALISRNYVITAGKSCLIWIENYESPTGLPGFAWLSLSVSLFLYLSLSIALSISLSLSIALSISLSLSLYFFLT